jgi:hypothetical protein
MHASATRICRGRQTLRLILNESHGESRGTGDAPKATVARASSDRTAAPFFGPQEDERMPPGMALLVWFALSAALWALVMVPVVVVLS